MLPHLVHNILNFIVNKLCNIQYINDIHYCYLITKSGIQLIFNSMSCCWATFDYNQEFGFYCMMKLFFYCYTLVSGTVNHVTVFDAKCRFSDVTSSDLQGWYYANCIHFRCLNYFDY